MKYLKNFIFLIILTLNVNIIAQSKLEKLYTSVNAITSPRELGNLTKLNLSLLYPGSPAWLPVLWAQNYKNKKEYLKGKMPFYKEALLPNQQKQYDEMLKETHPEEIYKNVPDDVVTSVLNAIKINSLKNLAALTKSNPSLLYPGSPAWLPVLWAQNYKNNKEYLKGKMPFYKEALLPNQQKQYDDMLKKTHPDKTYIEGKGLIKAPGTQAYYQKQGAEITALQMDNAEQYQALSVKLEGKYWKNMKKLFVLFDNNENAAIGNKDKDQIVNVYNGIIQGLGIGALSDNQKSKQVIGDIVNMLTTPTKGKLALAKQGGFLDWMNVILCVSGRNEAERAAGKVGNIPPDNRKVRINDTLLYGTVAMAMVSAIKGGTGDFANKNIDLNAIDKAQKKYITDLPVYQ